MAVIRGTSRGAFRSGRYATRSSSTATPAETAIPTKIKMAMETSGFLFRNPLESSVPATKNEPNAPHMNTSPWAKLIMRSTP